MRGVHPIERLRYVARATEAPADSVVREAAWSLASFADDPASMVTACRRLVDRHPGNGPIWWLCARILTAGDAEQEAARCVDELDADRTLRDLAFEPFGCGCIAHGDVGAKPDEIARQS